MTAYCMSKEAKLRTSNLFIH